MSSNDVPVRQADEQPPHRRWPVALRWLVRCAFLAAAVAAVWGVARWPTAAALVPAASPLLALASLAAKGFAPLALVGAAVGLLAAVRRRWFCRWACPTGTCADAASRLGRHLGCRSPRLPPLGAWIALATLGGACLGYPLLLGLDPLALFSGFFTAVGPTTARMVWWSAVGAPAVVLLSLLLPNAWCGRLCPLGATQEFLHRLVRIAPRRAEPSSAEGAAPERLAVFGRRTVLAGGVGAACAWAVQKARAAPSRPLRPPGAAVESAFTGLCLRCGNCVRACPASILSPDLGAHGLAGLLAPVLRFGNDYCHEDCVRCAEACPSGAIDRLTLEEKRRRPIGVPRVDMSVCLLGEDRECFLCRSRCPYEAISLVFSEQDYSLTPTVDLAKCPGCGACEVACPTRPVKAIVVRPPKP